MYNFRKSCTPGIDFSCCTDYVNQSHKPALLSEMVSEFEKTGQMPSISPLRPLQTETEDIESFSPETPGGDKIDSVLSLQRVMDNIDNLDAIRKDKTEKLRQQVAELKKNQRKSLFDELKKEFAIDSNK